MTFSSFKHGSLLMIGLLTMTPLGLRSASAEAYTAQTVFDTHNKPIVTISIKTSTQSNTYSTLRVYAGAFTTSIKDSGGNLVADSAELLRGPLP